MISLIAIALSIPPAVKTLVIIGSVYGILQGAKKLPQLTQYITGWKTVALNIALTACGMLVAIKPEDLYSSNTLNSLVALLITSMSSAGLHGTVKDMSPPTVLAVTPPSTVVKPVPATLIPDDPAAIPAVDLKGK